MRNTLSDRFSAAVRGEMHQRGLRAAALARLIDRGEMYLSRRFAGEVAWDLDDVEAVAVALETSPAGLMQSAERAAA